MREVPSFEGQFRCKIVYNKIARRTVHRLFSGRMRRASWSLSRSKMVPRSVFYLRPAKPGLPQFRNNKRVGRALRLLTLEENSLANMPARDDKKLINTELQ